MSGKHNLQETLLAPCLDVMRTLSLGEWDLISIIVVETVHELHNVTTLVDCLINDSCESSAVKG